MFDVYLASPFFNDEQTELRDRVKRVLEEKEFEVYSPGEENLYQPGDDPLKIFNENIVQIEDSQLVVAITNGKDVGTIWECGFAFAKGVDIIYVWFDKPEGAKFNLMLALSGYGVANDEEELKELLDSWKNNDYKDREYKGEIE